MKADLLGEKWLLQPESMIQHLSPLFVTLVDSLAIIALVLPMYPYVSSQNTCHSSMSTDSMCTDTYVPNYCFWRSRVALGPLFQWLMMEEVQFWKHRPGSGLSLYIQSLIFLTIDKIVTWNNYFLSWDSIWLHPQWCQPPKQCSLPWCSSRCITGIIQCCWVGGWEQRC